MNVSIFLRQFKAKNEDIVANIANGDVEKFGGAERLKGLLKLMPEKEEVNEGSINVCTHRIDNNRLLTAVSRMKPGIS